MTAPSLPGSAESGNAAANDPLAAPASPDGFRLQGDLPRVMRLSRKTLAIIGGAAGLAIGGALLWALQPKADAPPDNVYDGATANRSELVTGAPSDYGAIPKLGPPLPGDLGRPILSARNAGEAVPVPGMGPPNAAPDPREAAAAKARERAAQERDAARSSQLFLGSASSPETPAAPGPRLGGGVAAGPDDAGKAPSGRAAFLAKGKAAAESAERVSAPTSPYVVQAGSVIPAALITGIRSDLPGQISAQVTQNVYDSPTGRILLIPQGARLLGEYDSEVAAGQSRVLLAWDRLLLPGGKSIRLDRQPGADAAGMSGLQDRVDNHWGRMLRAALVSTLLGIGGELAAGDASELVRALRIGAQDSSAQAGRRIVERELGVPPTLTIRPGYALRVIVTRDLILEPIDKGDS